MNDEESLWRDWKFVANVIVLFLCIASLVYQFYQREELARRCLRVGYASSKLVDSSFTFTPERFCISRIDNTDVVVTVAEAEARPRR